MADSCCCIGRNQQHCKAIFLQLKKKKITLLILEQKNHQPCLPGPRARHPAHCGPMGLALCCRRHHFSHDVSLLLLVLLISLHPQSLCVHLILQGHCFLSGTQAASTSLFSLTCLHTFLHSCWGWVLPAQSPSCFSTPFLESLLCSTPLSPLPPSPPTPFHSHFYLKDVSAQTLDFSPFPFLKWTCIPKLCSSSLYINEKAVTSKSARYGYFFFLNSSFIFLTACSIQT